MGGDTRGQPGRDKEHAGMSEEEPVRSPRQGKAQGPAEFDDTARDRISGSTLKTYADENASLGTVLRSIYTQTVEESVPDEMLDLLRRLT